MENVVIVTLLLFTFIRAFQIVRDLLGDSIGD